MAEDYTPSVFSVPTYAETVAYEMYPGQRGQNDRRDAARHMLASGTLARKYSPGVAELLGKAHEWGTSPLQALMMLIGQRQPDAAYLMDTRNNALGAQLGARARTQAELESLVQAEAERAQRDAPAGRAVIMKAQGGLAQLKECGYHG
jgi:hypothetical protein